MRSVSIQPPQPPTSPFGDRVGFGKADRKQATPGAIDQFASLVRTSASGPEATAAGIVNAVGFTYCRAPLVQHAKAMLRGGALGPIMHVRGRHAEDYLADPHQPHSWRLSQAHAGRFGALGDLGYHIIAILRDLCGPLSALSGLSQTMHAQRRGEEDEAPRSVENEDYAAALLSFEGGAVGTVETSRIATGRKMELSFEIVCERGTLAFDAERMNELLLYEPEQPSQTQGFRTLLANATHPYYAGFLPAPGHQIGFNDLKTIEIYQFLEGVARGEPVPPDLNDAVCVSRICDAIVDSADTGARIQSPETYGGSEP
ncbi:MAG: Gfo/Idh/MocA family oxidoreductase [Pseudomonadota bacterium]